MGGSKRGQHRTKAKAKTLDIKIAGLTNKAHNQHQQTQQPQYQQQPHNHQHQHQHHHQHQRTPSEGISIVGKSKGKVSEEPLQTSTATGFEIAGSSGINPTLQSGISIWGTARPAELDIARSSSQQQHQQHHKHQRQEQHHHNYQQRRDRKRKDQGMTIKTPHIDQDRKPYDRPNGSERRSRSLFGFHMSQVVHQDNLDRMTAAAAGIQMRPNEGSDINCRQSFGSKPLPISTPAAVPSAQDLIMFAKGLADLAALAADTAKRASEERERPVMKSVFVEAKEDDTVSAARKDLGVGSSNAAIERKDTRMEVDSRPPARVVPPPPPPTSMPPISAPKKDELDDFEIGINDLIDFDISDME
ncbi:hypothetical protein LPJ66_000155 [Kickxella alabastrina]|uniref:Uncharacterized protein n=1 Tax=Kickxella alabastrina TaxID=61397 RepID=A0ACC1IWS2_9FUNG|nr:hypothetical protein LPJ66_000155 [Kickxella alabastrina]